MIVNYGYINKIVSSQELLNLKEQPYDILYAEPLHAIIPHRVVIRNWTIEHPYICNDSLLKIKVGDIEFGQVPTTGFLDVVENQFVVINISNCSPKLSDSVVNKPLSLVNEGTSNLLEGDSFLELHVFYSDVGGDDTFSNKHFKTIK